MKVQASWKIRGNPGRARIFHSNKVDDGCKRKQRKDSLPGVQLRTTIAIIRIAGAHKLPTVFMHSCFLANVHCGIDVSALANNANLNSTFMRNLMHHFSAIGIPFATRKFCTVYAQLIRSHQFVRWRAIFSDMERVANVALQRHNFDPQCNILLM